MSSPTIQNIDTASLTEQQRNGLSILEHISVDDLSRIKAAAQLSGAGIVSGAVTVSLTDNEYSALVSFTFNVGGPQLLTSTLLHLLNQNDRQGAADQFGKWVNGGGGPLPGLVRRRAAERALFLTA